MGTQEVLVAASVAMKEFAYVDKVRLFKRQLILEALTEANWNQSAAAIALHTHRNTLARWMGELGITVAGPMKHRARTTQAGR